MKNIVMNAWVCKCVKLTGYENLECRLLDIYLLDIFGLSTNIMAILSPASMETTQVELMGFQACIRHLITQNQRYKHTQPRE